MPAIDETSAVDLLFRDDDSLLGNVGEDVGTTPDFDQDNGTDKQWVRQSAPSTLIDLEDISNDTPPVTPTQQPVTPMSPMSPISDSDLNVFEFGLEKADLGNVSGTDSSVQAATLVSGNKFDTRDDQIPPDAAEALMESIDLDLNLTHDQLNKVVRDTDCIQLEAQNMPSQSPAGGDPEGVSIQGPFLHIRLTNAQQLQLCHPPPYVDRMTTPKEEWIAPVDPTYQDQWYAPTRCLLRETIREAGPSFYLEPQSSSQLTVRSVRTATTMGVGVRSDQGLDRATLTQLFAHQLPIVMVLTSTQVAILQSCQRHSFDIQSRELLNILLETINASSLPTRSRTLQSHLYQQGLGLRIEQLGGQRDGCYYL